ncbi:MAG TPA: DCC1-like thiol-disulfide oxidoreductase family protein [Verrucomicrobiae bacterium]|nr:DCC1-like thiol-disulfide oxidoreductase family protein [Verrucomicrobiae bacterium]
MNTEITDNKAVPPSGWICYDGDCPLCLRWLRRVERSLSVAGFGFVPLQTPWIKARLKLAEDDPLTEMRLLRANEQLLGGADAAVILMRYVWWLWPLWLLSRFPVMMPIFRATYRRIAANRVCATGMCSLGSNRRPATANPWLTWLPVILLPLATLPFRAQLPDWVFMWFFVTAMFFGCKWLTWRRLANAGNQTTRARTCAYLLLWPGMDARAFLTGKQDEVPTTGAWVFGIGRLLAGIGLVWSAAHQALTANDIANAWLTMLGLTLILHFGIFHLAALAWQRAGIPAKPLMQSPATATSLADFWGARWNTAFNKLIHDLAFRPLARRMGIGGATLCVFAISGIIHELAVSFPARGGYGLPTGYFLLQGVGVLLERSKAGRALGLGRDLRGWLFMVLITAGPAYWLFHPTFVQNVILPMLKSISAI